MAIVRGYRPELDGVRAVAILEVVAYHFQSGIFRAGALGVDVFFVLSGYLITGLLLTEREKSGTIKLRDFYARRAYRLIPALLMLLTVGAVVADLVLGPRVHRLAVGGLIAALYLTDIASYTHATIWATYIWTWSLSIEEHFYLLWPGLIRWFGNSRRRTIWIVYGATVAALLLAEITARGSINGVVPRDYYQPQAHAFSLMIGCAGAVTETPRWLRHTAIPALLGILALGAWSPAVIGLVYIRVSTPAIAIATVVLLLALEHSPRIATSALSLAPIKRIGVISYGLYLYHPLVYAVLRQWFHNPSLHKLALAAFVASIVVSEVSYRWYEAPIRRYGRSRIQRAVARRAAPVAT